MRYAPPSRIRRKPPVKIEGGDVTTHLTFTRRVSRFGRLSAAALLLVVVAACGSDEGDTGSTSAAPEATVAPVDSAAGATDVPSTEVASSQVETTTGEASDDSPIVVGVICACSGPLSSNYGGSDKVVTAWAEHVNENGGLNGHQVEVIAKDDAGDPATSLAMVQELVEKEKVAVIVAATTSDPAWADYVKDQHVAVVNGLTANSNFTNENPSLFLVGSSILAFGSGPAQIAKDNGKSTYGLLYCAEAPGCAGVKAVYEPLVTAAGLDFAFDGTVAASDPDYTAVCLAAQQAGVDVLDVNTAQAVWPRLAKSCHDQGYDPLWILPGSGDITPVLGEPSLDGAYVLYSAFPGFVDDPATKEYRDVVAKYLPDETLLGLGGAGPGAWVSAKLIEAATQNVSGAVTHDNFFDGLYSLKDETLGGLSPGPLNFEAGIGFKGVDCVYAYQIKGDEITAPNGINPTCAANG
jgi:branched-chain amino acid transport system substrate-binding protein